MTRELISKNAFLNHQDKSGKSPLYVAAENGASKVIEVLINNNANVNQTTPSGETALHAIARISSKPSSNSITNDTEIKIQNRSIFFLFRK